MLAKIWRVLPKFGVRGRSTWPPASTAAHAPSSSVPDSVPQRPPTAKGVGFVVLEDETGRLSRALPPALVAVGHLERVRWYRSIWAFEPVGVVRADTRHDCGIVKTCHLIGEELSWRDDERGDRRATGLHGGGLGR